MNTRQVKMKSTKASAKKARKRNGKQSERSINQNVFYNSGLTFIQLKANCACGGGCPRCMEEEVENIQAKLTINPPNDQYEKEADRIADQIISNPHHSNNNLSQNTINKNEGYNVQSKSSHSRGWSAPSGFSAHLANSKGFGKSMSSIVRTSMENAFGADLSQVRIHTDARAVKMNQMINAQAFTHMRDIYFGQGRFQPQTIEGKRLLAHELVHVMQQRKNPNKTIQRLGAPFGPAASGPPDWRTRVRGATTSAQKTALIQAIVGRSLTVHDATAASASDRTPDPAHLRPYTLASPVINFDQNLSSKRARAGGRPLTVNAGYTFQSGRSRAIYVVIADAALDQRNYYQTLHTINHEFDHVNQYLRASRLTGHASELDAWTTSFIREFHHAYQFRPTNDGSICYTELKFMFAPLSMYYQNISNASQKSRAVRRIISYYNSTVRSHAANRHAFKYWVYRSMQGRHNPALGTDLNAQLRLGINASDSRNTHRAIACSLVPRRSLPGGTTLSLPSAP